VLENLADAVEQRRRVTGQLVA